MTAATPHITHGAVPLAGRSVLAAALGIVASAALAHAQTGTVSRSTFTTAVTSREPVDQLVSSADVRQVYFHTELRDLAGRTVTHRWRCDDGRTSSIAFAVGGPRWRVWSRQPNASCAQWTVEVAAGDVVLATAVLDASPTVSVDIFRDFHYVPTGFPMGLAAGESPAGGLSETPFEPLVAEPKYDSAKVLYGYIPIGLGTDRRVTFVLDGLERATWQAWVDRNNNQDLTDDGPPILNEGTGRFAARVPLDVSKPAVAGRDRTFRYHVWLWMAGPSAGADAPPAASYRPTFYAVGHFAGTVAIGRRSYDAVAFERRNYDGVFENGDLCIDLNLNKACDEATEVVHEDQPVVVDGIRYRLRMGGASTTGHR